MILYTREITLFLEVLGEHHRLLDFYSYEYHKKLKYPVR